MTFSLLSILIISIITYQQGRIAKLKRNCKEYESAKNRAHDRMARYRAEVKKLKTLNG